MKERRLEMTVDRALLRRSDPPVSTQTLEAEKPLVIIIDDDAAIREALSELILSAGFDPVSFGATRELLEADVLDHPGRSEELTSALQSLLRISSAILCVRQTNSTQLQHH